jgi:photosystem II stability/assembly factor-like uncharacterized protein
MLKKFVLFTFVISLPFINVLQAQWQNYSNGIFCKNIKYIFADGNNVFAGTKDDGIYRSFDSGGNWIKTSSGLTDSEVNTIIKSGQYVFAGTQDSGVFLSSDNGSNWISVNSGLTEKRVISFTLKDNMLFAGTYNSGVFISSNNGNSWVQSNSGLSTFTVNFLFTDNNNIYLCSDNGIYKSTNNGSNWINISNNLPSGNEVKAVTASGNVILAGTTYGGGIFKSTNGGLNWMQSNSGFPDYPVIRYLININGIIFAATGFGVYYSVNYGDSWEPAGEGLYYPDNSCIAYSGSNIFSATEVGIFKSTDNGLNWQQSNSGIPPSVPVKSVFVNGSDIFAGTDGNGIFKSTNNGLYWFHINNGLKAFDIESMVIKDGIFFASTTEGIFKSTDNGLSWRSCFPPKLVYSLIQKGNYVIAGICSCSGGGVVRTSDYGESWEYVMEGLVNLNVTVLEQTSDKIFAGTSDGICYTTNFGDNWIACNSGLPVNNIISSMTVSGDTIYIGTTENGVFYSLNNNIQWSSISDGLQQGIIINSIKCFSGNLIASTPIGIYYKSHSSTVWIPINQGLTNNDMDAIVIKDDFVFIGSGLLAKNGIWRRPVTEITSVKKTNTSIIPNSIILYGNYPNPFNSMTKIKFSVPLLKELEGGIVSLTVFDLLGREVAVLVNEKLQPGEYEVRFDAGNLPSGIYFCRLNAGGFNLTSKIILMK